MVMEQGRGRRGSCQYVFFKLFLCDWIALASADGKIIQDPEVFHHVSCTTPACATWSVLGFSLFPYSCHLKYRSYDSKTAKGFAHKTICKFLMGFGGSFRQEKNYLQVHVSIFFHFL